MPSELAQQCCVTQATISGLLNSLEKAGLTVRETHISDRRACMIVITENGKELVQKIRPEFFNCLGQMMNQFTDDEEQKMVSWLGRLNQGLHLMNELKTERKLKIEKNI